MMSNPASRSSCKFPLFTATQWQELEHQALIYKHMAAGIPIPPDLLFSIKRNLDSTMLFSCQASSFGWNPYQMGYGGKKIDPEPGRCRRTDGKKWRCSKETYPDSKYCERHLHRGKNRSRKPVEHMATATAPNPSPIISPSSLSINKLPSPSSSSTSSTFHTLSGSLQVGNGASSDNSFHHGRSSFDPHFLYPHMSSQESTAHPLVGSNTFSRDRYLHAVKEEVSAEHAFFTESSGTVRGFSAASAMDHPWQQQQQQHQAKQIRSSCSDVQSGYPYLELKTDICKQDKQNQQLYMMGRDFSCADLPSVKVERETNGESKKTIHHFFDEWPPKGSRDSSPWHDSSTTKLSISMPTPSHDLFLSSSRTHTDG